MNSSEHGEKEGDVSVQEKEEIIKSKPYLKSRISRLIKAGKKEEAEKYEQMLQELVKKEVDEKELELKKNKEKKEKFWSSFSFKSPRTNRTISKNNKRFMPPQESVNTFISKVSYVNLSFDVTEYDSIFKPESDSNCKDLKQDNDSKRVNCSNFGSQYNLVKVLLVPEKFIENKLTYHKYKDEFDRRSVDNKYVFKFKYMHFYDNFRPPYFGTFSAFHDIAHDIRRNPFFKVQNIDYEVNSDEEWYEEDPGDVCKSEDEDEENETEVQGNNPEEMDGFLVPHGYLSDEEGFDDENDTPKAKKPENKTDEMKRIVMTKLKPVFFGVIDPKDPENYYKHIRKLETIFNFDRFFGCVQNPKQYNQQNTELENKDTVVSEPVSINIEEHIREFFKLNPEYSTFDKLLSDFYNFCTKDESNAVKLTKKFLCEKLKELTIKENKVYILK